MTSATLLAGVIVGALTIYTLTGGADFGAGVWDLLARGPRASEQRREIARAIGPIWEAHHVWLILALVVLFIAFPRAYAALSTALHVPITLLLIGIVLRGSAFVFRAYGIQSSESQRRWGLVFAISSTLTPVMLGVCVASLAAGRVPLNVTDFVSPWLHVFGLLVGLMLLAIVAQLAATYMAVEVHGPLEDDFRRKALWSGVFVFGFAWAALLRARVDAPALYQDLVGPTRSLVLQITIACLALAALRALYLRRFRAARVLLSGQVILILWAWAASQYPWILPGYLSIEEAAASPTVLRTLLVTLTVGGLLVLPAFTALYVSLGYISLGYVDFGLRIQRDPGGSDRKARRGGDS